MSAEKGVYPPSCSTAHFPVHPYLGAVINCAEMDNESFVAELGHVKGSLVPDGAIETRVSYPARWCLRRKGDQNGGFPVDLFRGAPTSIRINGKIPWPVQVQPLRTLQHRARITVRLLQGLLLRQQSSFWLTT